VRLTLDAEEGRLDAVVATMTGEARADVQRAIAAGKVHVDGEPGQFILRLSETGSLNAVTYAKASCGFLTSIGGGEG